jgi:hypothetical protein
VIGVSPVIGPEGRIHYLVGRITPGRDPSLPFVTATRASAWSAATDGSDVRRESSWDVSDVRIDARLPDGRYLVHRGSTNAQGLVVEDVQNLPANGGVIERIRIAPDGRSAYGFTSERIVRVDLTKLVPPATDAVNVYLDTSGEADVWFPTQLSLARGGERPPAAPSARYVFGLGGHAWQMENGVASVLRAGPLLRRTATPAPRWAPGGERALVVEQAGPTQATTTLVAVAIDRSGNATRLASTVGAGRSYAWSPGGGEVAIAVDKKGVSGLASDAELEVRFLDPTGRATRTPIAASEVAWTSRGIYLLGAGSTLLRLEGEGPARPVTTKERIVSDPRADPSRTVSSAVNGLDASADGGYASVRLQALDASSSSRSYVVIVGADGNPVRYLRSENVSDTTWSPAGALFGFTLDARTANERIQVVPAAGGDPVAAQDGRFAGWSPDGKWYYVGRTTGLFAYPLAGGSAVRVGPAGVPVSAAPR